MSVSQSSIYSTTPALQQLEEELQKYYAGQPPDSLEALIGRMECLNIAESYRMMLWLQKQLKNNREVGRKFVTLMLLKELILSGAHRFYLFASVKVLPWVVNLLRFESKKTEPQRVKAYLRQMSLGSYGDELVQERSCYKLFKFAGQFLSWFGTKLPFHLNSAFQFSSTFKRAHRQLAMPPLSEYQYFSEQDLQRFQKNVDLIEAESNIDFKDLSQFLVVEVRSLVDRKRVQSDILCELIKTGDSFTIKTLISQFCELLEDQAKLLPALKLMNNLMNVGEVEFVQLVKIYCVPFLLQYLFSIQFYQVNLQKCSPQSGKYIVQCLSLWKQITALVGLPVHLYAEAINKLQNTPNPSQQQLSEIKTNLIDMKIFNKEKIGHVLHEDKEMNLIAILKEDKRNQQLYKSAINELNDFKESRIVSGKSRVNEKKKVEDQKTSLVKKQFKEYQEEEKIESTGKKKATQFVDEKLVLKKISPSEKNQDSFIAFEPSQTSKYSEYSSSKNQPFKSEISSKKESSDPSIVYFTNSESFDSVHSKSQNRSPNHTPYISVNQKVQKSLSEKSYSESIVVSENGNKFIQSTYEFENSISSSASSSSDASKIINYGTIGVNLPEPQKKPEFAFKKAKIQKEQEMKIRKEKYENVLDNILSSHASVQFNNEQIDGRKLKSLKNTMQLPKNLTNHHLDNNLSSVDQWESASSKIKSNDQKISFHSISQKDLSSDKLSEIFRKSDRKLKSKRQKSEKASVINRENYEKKKALIIEEYNNDVLIELEREVGKAREQKIKNKMELKKKQKEQKLLRHKSDPAFNMEMKQLKKQNELLQILLQDKNRQEKNQAKQLKPIKQSNNFEDFFLENKVKGVEFLMVTPYEKLFIKQILGSRCLVLKNDFIELGYNYSQRQNVISLYLTLLKAYENVEIKVMSHSIEFEKEIDLKMKNQPAKSQLKIKRKVIGVKQRKKIPTFSEIINQDPTSMYIFPEIYISVGEEEGPCQQFLTTIPCSLFNLCNSIQINKKVVEKLKKAKVIRSQKLPLNGEFGKNTKEKINKHFPHYMNLVGGWNIIGFHFPESIFIDREDEFFKFRISELKYIEFQFFDDPKSLLAETLLKLFTSIKR